MEDTAPRFTRDMLMESERYRSSRDIIMVALEAEKEYTLDEVDTAIKHFLDQPVKEELNGGE